MRFLGIKHQFFRLSLRFFLWFFAQLIDLYNLFPLLAVLSQSNATWTDEQSLSTDSWAKAKHQRHSRKKERGRILSLSWYLWALPFALTLTLTSLALSSILRNRTYRFQLGIKCGSFMGLTHLWDVLKNFPIFFTWVFSRKAPRRLMKKSKSSLVVLILGTPT